MGQKREREREEKKGYERRNQRADNIIFVNDKDESNLHKENRAYGILSNNCSNNPIDLKHQFRCKVLYVLYAIILE